MDLHVRKLGTSDLEITTVGFGSWAVGGDWAYGWGDQDDGDSVRAIVRAVGAGVNWIDTAAIYGLGHSDLRRCRTFVNTSGRSAAGRWASARPTTSSGEPARRATEHRGARIHPARV